LVIFGQSLSLGRSAAGRTRFLHCDAADLRPLRFRRRFHSQRQAFPPAFGFVGIGLPTGASLGPQALTVEVALRLYRPTPPNNSLMPSPVGAGSKFGSLVSGVA